MVSVSTFVYASDLHGNVEAYDQLYRMGAEAVVLGGDLLPYPMRMGGDLLRPQVEFVRSYLAAKLRSRPSYWILGNDDWEAVLPLLEGAGTPIHGRSVPFLDGYSIAGYSCVPVTPFAMKDFDRFDGAGWTPSLPPKRCLLSAPSGLREVGLDEVRSRGTIAADLKRLAALSDPAKTVYVTHSPPYATGLDRLVDGTPIGSRAVCAFIERHRPPLTLHGHVHESPGIERSGATLSVNPGDSIRRLQAVVVDLERLSVTPLLRRT
jgi:Icc-related predicted phosphoesterase